VIEPQGAFYAFPSVEGQLGGDGPPTSMDLAAALLDDAKVAMVPGEAFGAPGYVRLSFALADADLEEGLNRWKAWAEGR
jgi:aspartate/methionine/tyrosine aminotransferase